MKTFCILPWIHSFISTHGYYRPCCISDDFENRNNILYKNPKENQNSDEMKKLRSEMLCGNRPNVCHKCWDKESRGNNYSKRISENEYWKYHIDINDVINNTEEDGTYNGKLISFDLRLGNLCNLKCIMCNPGCSSKWLEDKEILNKFDNTKFDYGSLDQLKWPKKDNLWNYLENNYEHIRMMQFAGGEPLLHKEHLKLINHLVNAGYSKRIRLKYNSNVTDIPNELIDLWNKFKRVDIIASIDGYDEVNDFIRYPSKWEDIERSLEKLDTTKEHINVTINSAISVLNIFHITELHEYLVEKQFKKVGIYEGKIHLSPEPVIFPKHLNVRILNKQSKEYVTKITREYLKDVESEKFITQMDYILDYMNSEDWHSYFPVFEQYLKSIRQIRNQQLPYS